MVKRHSKLGVASTYLAIIVPNVDTGSVISVKNLAFNMIEDTHSAIRKNLKEITAFLQNSGTSVRKHRKLCHFVTDNGTDVQMNNLTP